MYIFETPHLDCACPECQPLRGPVVTATILDEARTYPWAEWSKMIERGWLHGAANPQPRQLRR